MPLKLFGVSSLGHQFFKIFFALLDGEKFKDHFVLSDPSSMSEVPKKIKNQGLKCQIFYNLWDICVNHSY